MPYSSITKAPCRPHMSWRSPALRLSGHAATVLRLRPCKLLRRRLSIS